MKHLILVRGLPGAGKTTIVNEFFGDNVVKFCADDYFMINDEYHFDRNKLPEAHKYCVERTKDAMFYDQPLIAVHNTFTTEWEMQCYFKLAEEYGYKVHTIIAENRHGNKSIHNVPNETLINMSKRFQVKLFSEDYNSLVSIKEQNGLYVHKYKRKVFYNNLWNVDPKIMDARGLVLDKEGNIVQYPFTKLFNYKENGVTINPNHKVLAVEKVNGFMAAVSLYNGEILVSTTGSLESQYVDMAKEKLPLDMLKDKLHPNMTYMFEIVHENDPHIIPEIPGCYLLAYRAKQYGSPYVVGERIDNIAEYINEDSGIIKTPNWFITTFGELVRLNKYFRREGYVVYDQESKTVLKLKSPYYLTSKFIARSKDLTKIWEKNFKQFFDEEMYPICEFLRDNCSMETFLKIPEQERLKIIRDFYEKYEQ